MLFKYHCFQSVLWVFWNEQMDEQIYKNMNQENKLKLCDKRMNGRVNNYEYRYERGWNVNVKYKCK